jgi:hypothetical protein
LVFVKNSLTTAIGPTEFSDLPSNPETNPNPVSKEARGKHKKIGFSLYNFHIILVHVILL